MANSLKCPVCQEMLHEVTLDQISVDVCGKCSGIWFDYGEMIVLAEEESVDRIHQAFGGKSRVVTNQDIANSPDRSCPIDNTPLQRHVFDDECQIEMDRCPTCDGTWLDGGELETYAAYLQDIKRTVPALAAAVKKTAEADDLADQEEVEEYRESHPMPSVLDILLNTFSDLVRGKTR